MRWLGLVPLVGLLACSDPVSGHVSLSTDRGATLKFVPTQCTDGNDRGFFGVELSDDAHQIMNFYRRDDAPAVLFFSPGVGAFDLDRDDCEFLDGDLLRKFNSTTDNGKMQGSFEMDCTTPRGWHVEGVVSFEDCRAPEDDDEDHSHSHSHSSW
ncbi:MAG: hypothetical protein AAF799_02955 [Myxococcota bacterium]